MISAEVAQIFFFDNNLRVNSTGIVFIFNSQCNILFYSTIPILDIKDVIPLVRELRNIMDWEHCLCSG